MTSTGTDSPVSMLASIAEAPSRVGDGVPSRAALFGFIATPTPADLVDVPGGYGPMFFGFGPIATRTPDRTWNAIGRESLFGAHDAPNIGPIGSRIPHGGVRVLVTRPLGIKRPADITFQGVIEDDCGAGASPYSVTNAVMARITAATVD